MQDRPTAAELLDAVRSFLENDLIPTLEGRKKFHARVAANVLGIVTRELDLEEEQLLAEWGRLDDLLGTADLPARRESLRHALRARNETLCERIRAGEADEGAFRAAVLAHVRRTVEEKLAITDPKLLSAERAPQEGS